MRHLVVMASLSVLFWGADGQADICGRTCQSDVECPDSRGVCERHLEECERIDEVGGVVVHGGEKGPELDY